MRIKLLNHSTRKGGSRGTAVLVGGSIIALTAVGTAAADTLEATGDSLQGNVATVDLGAACPGDPIVSETNQLLLQIKQASGGTSFADGASLAFAYDIQGTDYDQAVSTTVPTGQSVPTNWSSQLNGSLANVGSPIVTVATSSDDLPSDTYYEAKVEYSVVGTTNVKTVVNVRWNVLASTDIACAPDDTTAPTSSATATTAAGAYTLNTWTNQNVTLTLSGEDDAGGSGLREIRYTTDGSAPTADTGAVYDSAHKPVISSDGIHTVKFVAVDNAGNVESPVNSVVVKLDKTSPVVSNVTLADGSWHNSNVTVTFRASDGLSGFTSPLSDPHTFTRTTNDEGVAVTVNSGTVNDVAGNTSNSVTSAAFKIDLTTPTVTCDAAPSFILNSAGGAVSATVSDDLSGPAGTGTVSGNATDTSSIGPKSIALTGYDVAGNSTTTNCGYNVVYDWSGFFRPVENLPTWNSVKAGSAVPVKFSLGGDHGFAIFGVDSENRAYPKSQDISCDSDASVDGIEQTVNAGSSSLSYDSYTGQYTYVWKTDKSWAGKCRQLVVKLADGTLHRANFKLLK